jgi:hypoxia up-regulated 1
MFFFVSLVGSTVFGIDFGYEYIKVAMAVPGRGVHVALNQQSKRLSPSYFAIWNTSDPKTPVARHGRLTPDELSECSWSFLDAAKSHSLRFPHNMIKGLSPLLSTTTGFTRRESLAAILRHLIQTIGDGRATPETAQIVMTVEPYLSRQDRIAIAEAVQLANATVTAIIDSPTAAAHVYALEKRSLFSDSPKTVFFVDFGATATWGALFTFGIDKDSPDQTPYATEIALVTNTSLGGNQMDEILAKFLLRNFEMANKIEVKDNPRLSRRFLEEARRAKELLTVNKAVEIKLEDLVDDYGMSYTLTREQFQMLIGDVNQSLQNLFKDALARANITAVDSIELIGGVTRVPYVQEVLIEVSGLEKLNRTMNSDEALALGAGYRGATESSAFIVMAVQLRSLANANVVVKHGDTEFELFNLSSYHDDVGYYRYQAKDNANISVVSGGAVVSTFFINLPENTTVEDTVSLRFGFDDLTVP